MERVERLQSPLQIARPQAARYGMPFRAAVPRHVPAEQPGTVGPVLRRHIRKWQSCAICSRHIATHRKRMVKEDLETKFKNPDDRLRIVFVCAMWITGFDVPSCSTIYLDKPMKNHTLMQTIARANRVRGRPV